MGEQADRKKTIIVLIVSTLGIMFFFVASMPEMFSNSLPQLRNNRVQQFSPPPHLKHDSIKNHNVSGSNGTHHQHGIILMWTFNYLNYLMGFPKNSSKYFSCGNYQCEVTRNRSKLEKSGVILFNPRASKRTDLPPTKEPWQRWVVQTRESPAYERIPSFFDGKANWTFDYTSKADVSWQWGFTIPHGQLDKLPFYTEYLLDTSNGYAKQLAKSIHDLFKENYKKLIQYKSKQIMWIVSNCGAKVRNAYVEKLVKNGLELDKFGKCGKPFPCGPKRGGNCERKLFLKYKFYIAFENSQCEDYITEKTWKCLYKGMVPVVLGPSIEDYQKVLPPDSFLHVKNFSSPAKLAEYITYLDNNDEAYLKYHAWRSRFSVVSTSYSPHLWVCDMCKKMHDPPKPAYAHISRTYRPDLQCNK